MATKNNKPSNKLFGSKAAGPIGIAVIGGTGTVIAAIITGFFGFLSTKAQITMPIYATQTAQADYHNTTSSEMLTADPATATADALLSMSDLLILDGAWAGCPANRVLPDSIDPNMDITLANDQFRTLLSKDSKSDMIALSGDNWVKPNYSFTLTASSSNEEWLILDKKISIYVHRQGVPENLNMAKIGGCGGMLEIRNFPEFLLDSQHENYMIEETYPDNTIAGFTLMPGEPELFSIPITCKSPGIYNLEVTMNFKYGQQQGELSFSIPPVTCPESYTQWNVYEFTVNEAKLSYGESYVWDGSDYVADYSGE